jgi:hypothetical protein
MDDITLSYLQIMSSAGLYQIFKIWNAEVLEIAEHFSRFSLAAIAGLNQRARGSA